MLHQLLRLLLLAIALASLSACDSGGFNPRSTSLLATLGIEGGTLEPAFSSDEQSYRLTLDDSGKPLTFTPGPAHDLATITINGQPVPAGRKSPALTISETPYVVSIRVVSPDETRFTEYRIVVLRPGDTVPADIDDTPPPSGSTTGDGTLSLSTLALGDAKLVQTFDPASTSYDATVSYLTTATRLTAKPADATAAVTVNGIPVKAPDYSLDLPLNEGKNDVEITIASADGGARQQYEVSIVRASADTFVQQNILKARTPERAAKFGFSIALVGDTAAIAAPEATVERKLAAGIVYIFRLIDGNWVEVQQLSEPSPRTGNRFGYNVAMDNGTLLISAFGYDGRRRNSGRVYIYQPETGGKWALQSSLDSPKVTTSERFGYNIALSGNNLAIATLRGPNGADSGGDVYLYQRDKDTWKNIQRIEIPGASDRFGHSIVIDDKLLAIGSFAEDDECRRYIDDPGSVTLYRLDGDEWKKITELKAGNPGGGDRFGFSLALTGKTLAVSAICEDSLSSAGNNDGAEVGAVYVFTEENGKWGQRAYIKEPTPRNYNLFGFRIALSGNLLAIGAPLSDLEGEDAGIAYLYQATGTEWKAIHTIQPDDVRAFDEFGVDLGLNGGNLLIGSIQTQQRSSASSGKVYSYR